MANLGNYLKLSTCHVREEVAKELDAIVKARAGFGVEDTESWQYQIVAERWSTYGWWVWPGLDDLPEDAPLCLRACMALAVEHGCSWILFDCDSEPTPELESYGW